MEYLNLIYTNVTHLGGYEFQFLNILSLVSILTAVYVIITKNPIISVLFLIGLFIGIAIYLVLIGLGFLGLAYLLVYVGAISILFLFILMLLNVRISELVSDTKNSIPLVFITALCFSLPTSYITLDSETFISTKNDILSFLYSIFDNSNIIYFVNISTWDNIMRLSDDINTIGSVMYTNYSILLVLVSFILLLAMVGTIVITLKPKDNSLVYSNDEFTVSTYKNLPLKSNLTRLS